MSANEAQFGLSIGLIQYILLRHFPYEQELLNDIFLQQLPLA